MNNSRFEIPKLRSSDYITRAMAASLPDFDDANTDSEIE
jgi:hypothetical protein